MNRLFRVLASCLFATVIAFGSLVGGAFAQATPSPATFSLQVSQSQSVQLNPQQSSFSTVFSTTNLQPATVVVTGGSCS